MPAMAFFLSAVLRNNCPYRCLAQGSLATHRQAASTRILRKRALPHFINGPERVVEPVRETNGAKPAIAAT